MKLTNPTDDQLNAAFAKHVAGWSNVKWRGPLGPGAPEREPELWGTAPHCVPGSMTKVPNRFTRSADAVLPWLEKMGRLNIQMLTCWDHEIEWSVALDGESFGRDKSLPRAAVIALLRAHGHEIEFTK